jgi:hypothetical protein
VPGPQATALTRSHRRELGLVAALAGRQMTRLARDADPVDIDTWWDRARPRALQIVTTTAASTATLGVQYLRQHAAIEGVRLEPVRAEPEPEEISTSLLVMGPVAFKKHMHLSGSVTASLRVMVDQLAGTASSRALDGQRDTVMATFTERDQLVGWRRLTSGSPCAFCAMLASRGAVYSKTTATFQAHKPRCRCTPEPLYEHEEEPASVQGLRRQWDDATAGLSGAAALNAFRRARNQEG